MVSDIFAKTNKYEDFLDNVEFDPRNPDANRVAIYRGIELQYDAKTADYCIDAYDRFRKKFDVYNNEEAFNCAIEGDVICIPEIKTYADFAKLYLASEFENKEGFYDAIYNGIRGQGEFIIDMYNLPDCIHIDYEAFGKKLEERFFDKTHYGEGKFILSPINGLLLYPTYSIFDNGVDNIHYLKNIKSFD